MFSQQNVEVHCVCILFNTSASANVGFTGTTVSDLNGSGDFYEKKKEVIKVRESVGTGRLKIQNSTNNDYINNYPAQSLGLKGKHRRASPTQGPP